MADKKYSFIKALSWYTVGIFMIRAVGFFTLRLFTDLLNTADYGIYGLYQSYLSIFEMILLLGAVHSIRTVKYDDVVDYDDYVSSVIYIPVFGMVLLLAAVTVVSFFTVSIADLSVELWAILFFSAGASSVATIIRSKFILDGYYRLFIVSSFINAVFSIGLSLFLCYTFFSAAGTYWGRVIGNTTASVLDCAFLLYFAGLKKPRKSYIRQGIKLGLPLLLHGIATQILVQSDKIIIGQMCSYSAVGIYTVANTISAIPSTALSALENSWSPWYYESLSKGNYAEIKEKNTRMIGWFALGIMLFVLASPEAVRLLTNREYWDAVHVLIPLSILLFAEMLYFIPLNLELYKKKNEAIWLYTFSAVVFNVIFDVVLIEIFGYFAGAYVTCASRFLLFGLHYMRAKKIDNHEIMDMRKVAVYSSSIFGVNGLAIFYIDDWIIRWGIMLIMLFGGIIVAAKSRQIKVQTIMDKLWRN